MEEEKEEETAVEDSKEEECVVVDTRGVYSKGGNKAAGIGDGVKENRIYAEDFPCSFFALVLASSPWKETAEDGSTVRTRHRLERETSAGEAVEESALPGWGTNREEAKAKGGRFSPGAGAVKGRGCGVSCAIAT